MAKKDKLFTTLEKSKSPVLGDLYSWTSAERHWTPKEREWFVSYSLFFVVIIAVAALLGQYIFILAVIAFVFLWFAQASIPPEIVKHTVNSFGIKTFGKLYKWKTIKHYWFSRKGDIVYLNLDTIDPDLSKDRTKRISLLLENGEENDLFLLLLDKIDYGDTDEVGYNIISRIIHGEYLDMLKNLPSEIETQEEYLQSKELTKSTKKSK